MSATIGTAEHSRPAMAGRTSATTVTGWLASIQAPTGMYRAADRLAAAAGPWAPVALLTELYRRPPRQGPALRPRR